MSNELDKEEIQDVSAVETIQEMIMQMDELDKTAGELSLLEHSELAKLGSKWTRYYIGRAKEELLKELRRAGYVDAAVESEKQLTFFD